MLHNEKLDPVFRVRIVEHSQNGPDYWLWETHDFTTEEQANFYAEPFVKRGRRAEVVRVDYTVVSSFSPIK